MRGARLSAQSEVVAKLVESTSLDATRISEFMSSLAELKTAESCSYNSYGAAMAPLSTNLTFWIGAFMLVTIFKDRNGR